jgi:hypothetical protein
MVLGIFFGMPAEKGYRRDEKKDEEREDPGLPEDLRRLAHHGTAG